MNIFSLFVLFPSSTLVLFLSLSCFHTFCLLQPRYINTTYTIHFFFWLDCDWGCLAAGVSAVSTTCLVSPSADSNLHRQWALTHPPSPPPQPHSPDTLGCTNIFYTSQKKEKWKIKLGLIERRMNSVASKPTQYIGLFGPLCHIVSHGNGGEQYFGGCKYRVQWPPNTTTMAALSFWKLSILCFHYLSIFLKVNQHTLFFTTWTSYFAFPSFVNFQVTYWQFLHYSYFTITIIFTLYWVPSYTTTNTFRYTHAPPVPLVLCADSISWDSNYHEPFCLTECPWSAKCRPFRIISHWSRARSALIPLSIKAVASNPFLWY